MKTNYEFKDNSVQVFIEYEDKDGYPIGEYLGEFKNTLEALRAGCPLYWNDKLWNWRSYADAN